jgi:hypothetical protein
MATKKIIPAAKPETALAVRKPSGNIVSIREQIAAQAAAMNERTAPPSGSTIRCQNDKTFKLPDGTTLTELDVVIVDFIASNKFFPGIFDANNVVPPACFAISVNPLKMVPSANSPENQSPEGCSVCANNVFGTNGAGKACKNSRILAVLPPGADENTPLWLLNVSPTGIKAFDSYVQSLARIQSIPVMMKTRITFDETKNFQTLRFGDPQPNENFESDFGRQEEAKKLLQVEPDVTNYVAAPTRGSRNAAPARAPARKAPAAAARR